MNRVVTPWLFVALVACGPKDPPKQASVADPVDDLGPANSATSTPPRNDAPPSVGNGKSEKGGAPTVGTLVPFLEGLRWGMSHAEVTKAFTETNGVIWKDYDEKLAHARVGPDQVALEAQREQAKSAFARSYLEFNDTPTGYDATGVKGEFTYKNKESLMWIERKGKKRFFFFINDRLWKVYDEYKFGGDLGATYLDAVNKLSGQVGISGRVLQANPAKGLDTTTVDWRDAQSHLRAIDRSNEGIVGVALEESSTLANLAALRPNKMSDPTAIDPSIIAVTKGNRSDPNAAPSGAPAAASSSGKKPGTKPPPKK